MFRAEHLDMMGYEPPGILNYDISSKKHCANLCTSELLNKVFEPVSFAAQDIDYMCSGIIVFRHP